MICHKCQTNRTLLRTGFPVLIVVLVSILSSFRAEACSGVWTPDNKYQNSEMVFLGRVVSIAKKKEEDLKNGEAFRVIRVTTLIPIPGKEIFQVATFQVEKGWKGIKKGESVEVFFQGKEFSRGKRYLVYAEQRRFGLESRFCYSTKTSKFMRVATMYLGQLSAGSGEIEFFPWLLKTARTRHERWIRIEALDMVGFLTRGSAPDISEAQEEALKKMAEDTDYEHHQYAQSILDKLKLTRKNRKLLPGRRN